MENFDLISREALLRKAQALLSFDGKEVVWVRDDVLLAPAVDPVHAAGACYCGECQHSYPVYPTGYSCRKTHMQMFLKETDFCSYGERREEHR